MQHMKKCNYCGTEIKKPTRRQKCGPDLVFCNTDCLARDCIEKHPNTSLGNMIKTMFPEIFENEEKKNEA